MTVELEVLEFVDSTHLERLHIALVRAAERDGVLDISYRGAGTTEPVGVHVVHPG